MPVSSASPETDETGGVSICPRFPALCVGIEPSNLIKENEK